MLYSFPMKFKKNKGIEIFLVEFWKIGKLESITEYLHFLQSLEGKKHFGAFVEKTYSYGEDTFERFKVAM